MEFNYEDWKELLKKLELSNKDVAEIIGTSAQNVNQQISPSKKLPTWARAMIWTHRQQPIEELVVAAKEHFNAEAPIYVLPGEFAREIMELKDTPEGQVMTLKQPDTTAPCGCSMTGRIFRRGNNCKLPREAHNF